MARQEKKTYDLSEAEQRDLFNLIQQGLVLRGAELGIIAISYG